jgi:hypothetical protein
LACFTVTPLTRMATFLATSILNNLLRCFGRSGNDRSEGREAAPKSQAENATSNYPT